jgi:uncharacterized protein
MRCQQCQMEMLRNNVGDVEIDLCVLCGGIYLDEGEFTKLTGLSTEGFERNPGRKIACAKCQTVMGEIRIEDVEIDICPGCQGIWLDHHELARFPTVDHELLNKNKIVSFIESKQQLMTRPTDNG